MQKEYTQTKEQVLEGLRTDRQGLSAQEAEKRLREHGENRLKEAEKLTLFQRFVQQLKDPMLLILLMAAGALLETVFIMQSYRRRCVRSVIFKTLASACFVLLAMQCIRIRGTSDYARLVFWGLVCGLLGDALLALRFLWKKTHDVFFIAGTLAFFAGHIFYILAILKLAPDAWQYAIPLALIALGVAGFYSNAKQVRAGKILPLGIIYIGEVLFVAACALSGALQTSSRALFLFFVGGVCFSASDNMLVVLSFGTNDNPYRNAVLHVLYYMAQVFIAVSILFL